jgi:DNA-binding transcriptional ArsR family regulator
MQQNSNPSDFPPPKPDIPEVMVIENLETLKVYVDTFRRRILSALSSEPKSVQQIAETLQVPFTRLYYHIRMLEKHGLIRLVATRKVLGGVKENYYFISAYHFLVARDLKDDTPESTQLILQAVFNATLDNARQTITRAVEDKRIDLKIFPPHPNALLLRYGMIYASPERAQAYQQRILELINTLESVPDEPNAQPYNIIIGFYSE